jgi:alpha-amylase/alpha-mannosidase (GH57 family)
MASAIVHCHFYQPPRENPWRDVVEAEPSAAPFHDWNARINHECYEPFAAARVLDDAGHVARQLNLYEWVSFDVGTTLARWLEANEPKVYDDILAADRASAERLRGHGNAIAAPYNHVILPLASWRDKVTEIRWGLADFRRRFGRDAEGMWLPETAVDEETLVAMAQEGVKFTILAPHQVENTVQHGVPLRFAAGGGRSVALLVYDGALAHDAAFGSVLNDGAEFARRLANEVHDGAFSSGVAAVRSIALDGETFGHHRRFAEMALAGAVSRLVGGKTVCLENFASMLDHVTPTDDAVLVEPSSWSCAHGVERWRSNCADGIRAGASHAWRRPLRAALNWLARELDDRYTSQAAAFGDAWSVRNAFGGVAAAARAEREAFVATLAKPGNVDALTLLDGVRARLGMFGSCAWFFDDATGHETELMLRLAAFAIDAIAPGDTALETEFVNRLALVRDDGNRGDAAAVFRERVRPLRVATA